MNNEGIFVNESRTMSYLTWQIMSMIYHLISGRIQMILRHFLIHSLAQEEYLNFGLCQNKGKRRRTQLHFCNFLAPKQWIKPLTFVFWQTIQIPNNNTRYRSNPSESRHNKSFGNEFACEVDIILFVHELNVYGIALSPLTVRIYKAHERSTGKKKQRSSGIKLKHLHFYVVLLFYWCARVHNSNNETICRWQTVYKYFGLCFFLFITRWFGLMNSWQWQEPRFIRSSFVGAGRARFRFGRSFI